MSVASQPFSLEHPLVKVPCELLNITFRNNQRMLEKEVQNLGSTIGDLCKKEVTEQSLETLEKLTVRLKAFKRKIEEGLDEEQATIKRCKTRLDHLSTYGNDDYDWVNQRLDRVMSDYLLRKGYHDTAAVLAKKSNIEELVDTDVFIECHVVENSLTNHDCSKALQWCSENRSKLKKMNSFLEFNLRVQEFIELIREKRNIEAIAYAKKHLSPHSETCLKELVEVMGCLAFGPNTECPKYQKYFEEARWKALCKEFQNTHHSIYCLTPLPLLNITLQSGLSAQKTRMCYQEGHKNFNCPVCSPLFNILAKDLPFSHRTRSQLVCYISNEVMSSANPPLMLPNGHVYSQNALTEISDRNHGFFSCPRTGETFHSKTFRKVFIM